MYHCSHVSSGLASVHPLHRHSCSLRLVSGRPNKVLVNLVASTSTKAICFRQNYYVSSARELARMVGIRKAPILHHFSESLAGAITIRCFNQQRRFSKKNLSLIDDYSRITFHNSATMEWLSVRINFLFNLKFFAMLTILVSMPRNAIDPSKLFSIISIAMVDAIMADLRFCLRPCRTSRDVRIEPKCTAGVGYMEPLQRREQDDLGGEDSAVLRHTQRGTSGDRGLQTRTRLAYVWNHRAPQSPCPIRPCSSHDLEGCQLQLPWREEGWSCGQDRKWQVHTHPISVQSGRTITGEDRDRWRRY